ncbi:MAG: hypothetical protein KGL39_08180 [Patescibacteria group bacterium]|nr:hypothetical protein [Patescibacteria group bacterium]
MRTVLTVVTLAAFTVAIPTAIDGNAWPLVRLTLACTAFVLACGAVAAGVEWVERKLDGE